MSGRARKPYSSHAAPAGSERKAEFERAAARLAEEVRRIVRRLRKRRRPAPPRRDRRPDGTLVARSPALPPGAARRRSRTRGAGGLSESFASAFATLAARWQEALSEGRQAAHDKEIEIRAEYARRVDQAAQLPVPHYGEKES